MIFDFPEPLGPEMVVKSLKNGILVLCLKDLKFWSSISLIYKADPYHLFITTSKIRDCSSFCLEPLNGLQSPLNPSRISSPH